MKGYTNVRWVTVANEPNTTNLTMPEYEALYRALDAQLVERGLREHIHLMGGDLVRDGQRAWFQYIAANMNDVLDAYSVHIYWDYWNTPFFTETRLKDVRQIVTEELPVGARKPTYVMEYGVRGIRNFEGKPTVESGYWEDGTDMARTNIAAFQQLWFDLASVQLGFTGSVKWDAYWGKYNGAYNSLYAMIGPASEGWPLFPAYHALGLLLQTTQSGWQVLQVAPWDDDDWKVGVPDQPGEGARGVRGCRRPPHGDGARLARPRPQHRLGGRARPVQHRRPAAGDDVHPRAVERDGRRREHDRRQRHDECRRSRAVRGAAAGSLRAHDRARLLRARGARPRPDAPHTRASYAARAGASVSKPSFQLE